MGWEGNLSLRLVALPDSQSNDLYVPHCVDIPCISFQVYLFGPHCVDIPGISLDIYERNTWFGTPGPQQIMITGQSAMEQNKITNKSKQIGATTCNI